MLAYVAAYVCHEQLANNSAVVVAHHLIQGFQKRMVRIQQFLNVEKRHLEVTAANLRHGRLNPLPCHPSVPHTYLSVDKLLVEDVDDGFKYADETTLCLVKLLRNHFASLIRLDNRAVDALLSLDRAVNDERVDILCLVL